jgi:rhodanese-related sulfurtransferase
MNLWADLILLAATLYVLFRLVRVLRPAIPPATVTAALAAGQAVLVDVREPAEWESGVAAGAALLALSDLRGAREQWKPFLEQHRGRRLLLYCLSGTRSGLAAFQLRREGFDAVNLGTLTGWRRAGGKVVPPARA